MADEFGVGLWLASAAFCSGTIWQPTVNFFAGLGFAFPMVALFACAAGTAAFCSGLRIGRRTYTGLGIEKAHSRNFHEDAGLSLAIGGAAGMFVGTDITILKNPFDTFVGVYPDMTPLQGCIKAGTSTAVGFALVHSIQNSRAESSTSYVTKDTWRDIVVHLVIDIGKNGVLDPQSQKKIIDNADVLFNTFDTDGDGKLTPEEVKEGLHKLAANVSPK